MPNNSTKINWANVKQSLTLIKKKFTMANLRKNYLEDFQIYVGTYYKYNNGSIYGDWLKLSDYSDFDELQNAMRELHKSEEDPEFMFQDYEMDSFFEDMNLISESYISSEIYEVLQKLEDFTYDFEVVKSFVKCFGMDGNIDEVFEKIEENYNGEFNSDEDFAENLLTECGTIPENLPNYVYIDWERTARDIMFDYTASGNHYFRNY